MGIWESCTGVLDLSDGSTFCLRAAGACIGIGIGVRCDTASGGSLACIICCDGMIWPGLNPPPPILSTPNRFLSCSLISCSLDNASSLFGGSGGADAAFRYFGFAEGTRGLASGGNGELSPKLAGRGGRRGASGMPVSASVMRDSGGTGVGRGTKEEAALQCSKT
jgi:hypothetical protein